MEQVTIQALLMKSLSAGSGCAIYSDRREVSYGDLQLSAKKIALEILKNKFPDQVFIGVLLSDPIDYIPVATGIFFARVVYVPVDRNLPEQLIKHHIDATGLKAIITDKCCFNEIYKQGEGFSDVHFMILEDMLTNGQASDFVAVDYHPDDQLYIYFTSGSTGKPKPVIGKNRSLANFINWEIRTFGLTNQIRSSQFIHIGFDAWLRDVFVPLVAGGCICIPELVEGRLAETDLTAWVEHTGITLIHCVPSFFRFLNNRKLDRNSFPSLRYVLLSGEPVSKNLLKNWYREVGEQIQLVNLYGTTETTMIKTFHRITPADINLDRIPVGKAIDNTEILILTKDGDKCQLGEIGEICIKSTDLSHGYYPYEDFNNQRFISEDGRRLIYKTGDAGRFLPDGDLEILGRTDRQVKVRGVRVDLAEIEKVILELDIVNEAVAVLLKDDEDNASICVYFTAILPTQEELVRAHAAAKLPRYMQPGFFCELDRIPLLPNGKTDLAGFPNPKSLLTDVVAAEESEVQKKIRACWAAVLKISTEKIDTRANFFQLGGNSIQLLQLLSAIMEQTGCRIPLEFFLKKPFLQDNYDWLNNQTSLAADDFLPATPAADYAVTTNQERMFKRWEADKNIMGFNMPSVLEIEGEIIFEQLQAIFARYVSRQEVFRTRFERKERSVRQAISKEADFKIEIQIATSTNLGSELAKCIRPFDLGKEPLIRVSLLITPDQRNFLVMDIHHIINDAISMRVIEEEIIALFNQQILVTPSVFFKDYAEWMTLVPHQKKLRQQRAYWLNQYRNIPGKLNLPIDFPRPLKPSSDGEIYRFFADEKLVTQIKMLAGSNAVTVFTLLLSCFYILLYKITGNEDIVIGIPASGRNHQLTARMLGLFVGELAMRMTVNNLTTFNDFLALVHQKGVEAFENQSFQYNDLLSELQQNGGPVTDALFDVWFAYQKVESPIIQLRDDLKLIKMINNNTVAMFDMLLRIYEVEKSFELRFEYRRELFKEETIAKISSLYIDLFEQITADPSKPVGLYHLKMQKTSVLNSLNGSI